MAKEPKEPKELKEPKQPKEPKEPKAAKVAAKVEPAPTPRLLERYQQEIVPQLAQQLGRTNPYSLPRLEKIVVSMGVSSSVTDKKFMEEAVTALGGDHRPEASPLQGEEERRRFPCSRRNGPWLQGDAPRSADVRVFGSADFAGVAAGPRFSRPAARTPSTATGTTASV